MKRSLVFLVCILVLFEFTTAQNDCRISIDNDGKEINNCLPLHNCLDGKCVHKGVFPLTIREIVGAIIITFISGLANSGGLGGGSLLTTLLLVLYNYTPLISISIVYCMIFGGSLGNFINVCQLRDKVTKKPIVNYDIALICLPTMMLGVQFGILFNRTLPAIVPVAGLTLLVIVTLKRTWIKAKNQYNNESISINLSSTLNSGNNQIELRTVNEKIQDYFLIQENPLLHQLLEKEKQLFPFRKIKEIIGLLLGLLLLSLLRGTAKFPSIIGIEYCGIEYWLVFKLSIVLCGYSSNRNIKICMELEEQRQKSNSDIILPITSLTSEKIRALVFISGYAGVLAGALGIGGGMILGQYFLDMKISPQSTVATSGLFVLITSFLSMFQTLLFGALTIEELLWYLILSLIGSFLISFFLTYLVNKYKRQSVLLFTLCLVLGISLLILPMYATIEMYLNPRSLLTFNSICS